MTCNTIQQSTRISCRLLVAAVFFAAAIATARADTPVQGSFVANGEAVELPHVYIWPKEEGFYDADDPTYTILFVGRELSPREIGRSVWDAPWVEIGITQTDEFGEGPALQVYTQTIRMSADSAGTISGGNYPEIEINGLDGDRVSGHVWHSETQTSFDDSYQYDLTFEATLFDPNAPIGEPLPADGGEPGAAYLNWVKVIHSGDMAALMAIIPPELAEQMNSAPEEEVEEQLYWMKAMTPTEVTVTGGSIDGDEAYLDVQGKMDGEMLDLEVTMSRTGEFWIPTNTSM